MATTSKNQRQASVSVKMLFGSVSKSGSCSESSSADNKSEPSESSISDHQRQVSVRKCDNSASAHDKTVPNLVCNSDEIAQPPDAFSSDDQQQGSLSKSKSSTSNHCDSVCDINSDSIGKIKLVSQAKKRGRPKGSHLTAIGLRKKSLCRTFSEISSDEKASIILSWVVPAYILKKVDLKTEKITIDHLRLKMVPCWFYDNELIHLELLQNYMEVDAYELLKKAIEKNSENIKWICYAYKKNLYESQSLDESSEAVLCDGCMRWFHKECEKIDYILTDDVSYFCTCCVRT